MIAADECSGAYREYICTHDKNIGTSNLCHLTMVFCHKAYNLSNAIDWRQNMEYGYARVSSREQNEERQIIALKEFGIQMSAIYVDKQSGKDFDRQSYRRLMRKLKNGDTLVVKSIDRLGRNYDEILEQWRYITKEKCAAIVVLDMPLLDTRQNRDLTGTLIADIVLQLLSYVAQTEREFIRQRQAEGIAAAKARGVRFGRPSKPDTETFYEALAQWRAAHISVDAAAKACGMSKSTFYRRVRMHRE